VAEGKHHGHLGAVYAAKSKQDIAELYDKWASTYDDEMVRLGYRHPAICLALIARYVARGSAPLLDAGAGTGLVGEWLKVVGYPQVEALDISEGMLAVAAQKKIYSKLHCLALGERLPFADNCFKGIVSAGVFTTGHVGAEALGELIRITAPGGAIVLTVKNALWETGFAARIAELEKTKLLRFAEETAPYVSMPGETGVIPSRGIALVKV
jgi:predicted TPR repeat methyltransferase